MSASFPTARRAGLSLRSHFSPRWFRPKLEWLEDRTLLATGVLVADINPINGSSVPADLTSVGSLIFFTADDGIHGQELWKTDGTSEGTALVCDIQPGPYDSFPDDLTDVNGTLFFTVRLVDSGRELWMSDGTAAGTLMLADIYPGSQDSSPLSITAFNGTAYFTANHPATGRELWTSDGTPAGTKLVADIVAGPGDSSPGGLVVLDNLIYFSAFGTGGRQLFRTDGTSGGTFTVGNFSASNGILGSLTPINGTIHFVARTPATGTELWSYVPGNDVSLVKDINPGTGHSDPRDLINVNGTLFFIADDFVDGYGLYTSDGSAAGTVLVKEDMWMTEKIVVGNQLFFAHADLGYNKELWVSDGTTAGTHIVKDLIPGPAWGGEPQGFVALGDTLYFCAQRPGPSGNEPATNSLWRSDGTEAGTYVVKESLGAGSLTAANGTLYLSLGDGVTGGELWRSDGTTAGTVLITDINTSEPASSDPLFLIEMNGRVYFAATTPATGMELWSSDGTAAGTALVFDAFPGAGGCVPRTIAAVDDLLYFWPLYTDFGAQPHAPLWRTDGTADGTIFLQDPMPSDEALEYYVEPVAFQNRLFFIVRDFYDIAPEDMIVSDGTPEGTGTFIDMTTGEPYFKYLTVCGDSLYFVAYSDAYGSELFKTDGTVEGTVVVKDFHPGPLGSNVRNLTNVNGTIFFEYFDQTNGYELWTTDGTDAGTVRVLDLYPGLQDISTRDLGTVDDRLLVSVRQPFVTNHDLWSSDGTAGGTVLLQTFPAPISFVAEMNGWQFFISNMNGGPGAELWRTDGTAAGTQLVKEFDQSIGYFPAVLDGTLYFNVFNGTNDTLWQSDGTSDGTVSCWNGVADNHFVIANGTLFFAGNDGTVGTELYRLDRNPIGRSDSSSCDEEGSTVIDVRSNDSDPEGDAFSVTAVNTSGNGTAIILPDGTIHYSPNPDFNGTDTFTYTITDSVGNTATGTVEVTVYPVNDAPAVSVPGGQAVDEDNVLVFSTLAGNALAVADVDANAGLVRVALSITNGTLSLVNFNGLSFSIGDGNANTAMTFRGTLASVNAALEELTFAPLPDYHGPAVLQIQVDDQGNTGSGGLLGTEATVNIDIVSINDPPVASIESFTMDEDGSLLIPDSGVLVNDGDADGDTLSAILVSGPSSGSLNLDPNGGFLYIPESNFFGTVTFTYKANDGQADSDPVTVTIEVRNLPDAPSGVADTFDVAEDGVLTILPAENVLLNDTNPDGEPLTATVVSGPDHGSLSLNVDGTFTYQPSPNYHGPDSFFYIPVGALPGTATQVSINVTSVNDHPLGQDDALTLAAGQSTSLAVLANELDPDGDPLFVSGFTQAAHGIVTFDGVDLAYTPNPGFLGTDTFTYIVSDSEAAGTATVTLTVLPGVNFTLAGSQVAERKRKLKFIVTLTSPVAQPVTVNFVAIGGTADLGTDFLPLAESTATFKPNKLTAKLRLRVLDDQFVEGDETVLMRLTDASAAVAIGARGDHTLTIRDNDVVRVLAAARSAGIPMLDAIFSENALTWPRRRR